MEELGLPRRQRAWRVDVSGRWSGAVTVTASTETDARRAVEDMTDGEIAASLRDRIGADADALAYVIDHTDVDGADED